MPTLSVIAAKTARIRLGTLVLNNDMRNPVQLAWEASTLDRLSGGRFELLNSTPPVSSARHQSIASVA